MELAPDLGNLQFVTDGLVIFHASGPLHKYDDRYQHSNENKESYLIQVIPVFFTD